MGCCCGGILSWFLVTGAFVLAGIFLGKKDRPKIAGVYTQPGKLYWFKVLFFVLLMKLRKVNLISFIWRIGGAEGTRAYF